MSSKFPNFTFDKKHDCKDLAVVKGSYSEPESCEDLDEDSAPLPKSYKLCKEVVAHQFTDLLPAIERLSLQGLKASSIASRLAIPLEALTDAAAKFPDVEAALSGGRARGLEGVTKVLYKNAIEGETSAISTYLKLTGEIVSKQTSVVVNVAASPMRRDIYSNVVDLVDSQRRLIEDDSD